jgi:uncharacterized protein YcfL
MKKTLIAILTCTLLAGCATQPSSPDNRMFTKNMVFTGMLILKNLLLLTHILLPVYSQRRRS